MILAQVFDRLGRRQLAAIIEQDFGTPLPAQAWDGPPEPEPDGPWPTPAELLAILDDRRR